MGNLNKKYILDTKENRTFMEEICDNLLSFGHQFPAPDGSSYYLGDNGSPWKDRNRETWITCRMTHVYSIGTILGHSESRKLVQEGIKGLTGVLHDREHGGWYVGITPDGNYLPNKQCYAHAFVILAASSAQLIGCPGAEELLKEALCLYDERFWNEKEGLSCDTWNTEFTVRDTYRGINANMHTVEAFLAVADVLNEEKYRTRAGRVINHVKEWASANEWRIPEHFNENWTIDLEYNKDRPDDPFKPYGATPGHGIEWARLVVQWALSTYKNNLNDAAEYIAFAEKLYNRAIKDGWNVDGAKGICYTTDWNGVPVVHDRMHWTLAEAINTSSILYHVTKKQKYAEDYYEFMQYLDECVLDKVNGSWFHQLDQQNRLLNTVWPGKSDIYHALQATLIPNNQPDCSIAVAVKKNRIR